MDIPVLKDEGYYIFEMPDNDVFIQVSFSKIKNDSVINPNTGIDRFSIAIVCINIVMISLIGLLLANVKRLYNLFFYTL